MSDSSNSGPDVPADNIRSAKDLKQSLLKRAIAEGRGHDMIKLIQWRLAQIRHDAAKDKEAIREARFMKGQPKSVRALNTLAFHKDDPTRFSMDDNARTDSYVHPETETVN